MAATRSAGPSPRPSAGRVLVVDDDEDIRELVGLILTDAGHEVVTAANGAVALELLRAAPARLILLDMWMPVMDGWTFAKAYRRMPGPRAPILVMTAAREAAERAADIAVAVLIKPFDIDDLMRCVERCLAETGVPGPVPAAPVVSLPVVREARVSLRLAAAGS